MRIFIKMLLLITFVSQLGFAQSFKFADEYPFKSNYSQGKVEISLDQTVLQKGERYYIDYKFTNTGGGYSIYNWQFMEGIGLPGQLAIYDADKNYIGDLSAVFFVSRGRAQLTDWIYLRGGSYVGKSLGFRVPMTKHMLGESLPSGTYYLQLIIYKVFVSERPYLNEEVVQDLRQNFDRSELCRSNVIKVVIVD